VDRSDAVIIALVALVIINEARKKISTVELGARFHSTLLMSGIAALLVTAVIVISWRNLRLSSLAQTLNTRPSNLHVKTLALRPRNPSRSETIDGESLSVLVESLGVNALLFQCLRSSEASPLYIALWVDRNRISKEQASALLNAAEGAIKSMLSKSFEVEEENSLSRNLTNFLPNLKSLSPYSAIKDRLSISIRPALDLNRPEWPRLLLGRDSDGKKVWIPLSTFSKHVLIMGRTGSGKTTTAMSLCERLWSEFGIPFLVLDHHNEYAGFVLRLGGKVIGIGPNELSVNVFKGLAADPSGVSISVELLRDALELTPSQCFITHKCLQSALRMAAGEDPTLADLLEEISEYRERTAPEMESKLALLRKLEPLVAGEGRAHLIEERMPDLEDLSYPLAVELASVESDDVRNILVHVILKRIYDAAKSWGLGAPLKLVVLIEEGERVMPIIADERGSTVLDKMLSELRKFGVGIIVVTQAPHALSRRAMRNSAIKIIHSLGSPEDARAIKPFLETGSASGDRKLVEVHTLRPGMAFLTLEGDLRPRKIIIVPPTCPTAPLQEESISRLCEIAPEFYLATI